ncbi:hypothetical protein WJS89_01945 [Sphingomicrobium sp. XHP0235]|uniref:hypothetical protein n=1 Tax=Sphingomicrobium aquimarinum TaxID=3133971 RepID=UPI0031FE4E6E
MSIDHRVLSAKNEVEVKRAQLLHSIKFALGETKRRLAPDLLAEMAWQETKRAGSKMADGAVDFTKRKPWLVGGIAAAAGLFLARKPVGRLAVDGYEALKNKGDPEVEDDFSSPASSEPSPHPNPDPTPTVSEFREAGTAIEDKAAPAKSSRRTNKTTEDVK